MIDLVVAPLLTRARGLPPAIATRVRRRGLPVRARDGVKLFEHYAPDLPAPGGLADRPFGSRIQT